MQYFEVFAYLVCHVYWLRNPESWLRNLFLCFDWSILHLYPDIIGFSQKSILFQPKFSKQYPLSTKIFKTVSSFDVNFQNSILFHSLFLQNSLVSHTSMVNLSVSPYILGKYSYIYCISSPITVITKKFNVLKGGIPHVFPKFAILGNHIYSLQWFTVFASS